MDGPRCGPPPRLLKLDRDMMDEAERRLENENFQPTERVSVEGFGKCFGATAAAEPGAALPPKEATLVRSLNQLLREALRRHRVGFGWDSIQINKDTIAAPHSDQGTRAPQRSCCLEPSAAASSS